MESLVISEDSISREKSNYIRSGLCCCRGSRSRISIDAKNNNHYEYVVEKLVIKRVPVKTVRRCESPTRVADKKYFTCSNNDDLQLEHLNERRVEQKPIVFSSYCQLSPHTIGDNEQNESSRSPRKMCTYRTPPTAERKMMYPIPELPKLEREQNWSRHSPVMRGCYTSGSPSPRSPSINSEKSRRNIVPVHLPTNLCQGDDVRAGDSDLFYAKRRKDFLNIDPAIRETLDMLARKKEQEAYFRGDSEGFSKDSHQSEIPLRLQDVYNDNSSNGLKIESPQGDESTGKLLLNQITSDIQANKEVKWKIIIKHRKDRDTPKYQNYRYYEDAPEKI